MEQVIAKSKYVHVGPRKLRLVADKVRGLKAQEAQVFLENLNKTTAEPILLVLKQGIGNAVGNFNLQKDSLKIKSLQIGEGPMYKRMDKAHRSFRWGTVQKRTSHIRMVLEGEQEVKKQIQKQAKKAKPVVKKTKGGKNGTKS
jgi:large subunit ribosomal protein L22